MKDRSSQNLDIRPFSPADRPALEAMYVDFEPKRAAQGLPPGTDDGLRRWLDRTLGTGTHVVAEVDGAIRGHVMLMPMEPCTAELANFVHQSVRGRGIGTALNRAALDAALSAGYRRVWLSVEPSNRVAMRSYERAGFRRLPGSLWAPEIEMAVELEPIAAACP